MGGRQPQRDQLLEDQLVDEILGSRKIFDGDSQRNGRAENANVPLVATHSNAIAVCNTTRNLTDDQLKAVGETGGIAGLNFGTIFLDSAAWKNGRCRADACIRQLAHMIEIAGEDHVAIGSDFDGAPLPDDLQSAVELPILIQAMEEAGFGEALIAKIANENWLSFLSKNLN